MPALHLFRLGMLALAMTCAACDESGRTGTVTAPSSIPVTVSATRSFWLGFSPWPWDATQSAIDWTWAQIRADGDVISHHIEEGVPWPQAATGVNAAYPPNFQAKLIDHRTRGAQRRVLVQINPLSIGRDALAPMRTEQPNQPLLPPWSGATLDSPEVKTAFTNYALRMVGELSPDVLLTGIEVNLLLEKNASLWPAYVALQCHVYAAVKAARPDLPVGVSLVALALLPEWATEYDLAQQQQALSALAPCIDMVAWSVHPFMSGLLADAMPADFFARFLGRLPAALQGKPMGISESSYPAQAWSLKGLTWNGTPAKQRAMLELMLAESQRTNMKFVVWFAARDYDALWAGLLGRSELALIWRDTGLHDERGTAREAMTVWRAWHARALSR